LPNNLVRYVDHLLWFLHVRSANQLLTINVAHWQEILDTPDLRR